MRKVFFSLLGIAAFVAIALMPATSFAATSTRTAKSHKVHIFHNRGHIQPYKAASASASANVVYHGGPVMAGTTNVYAIFWEPPSSSVSANYNTLIKRYYGDIGGSPLYKINNQYIQTGGAFPSNAVLAGSVVDTRAYPESPLLDSDIQTEVTNEQTANSWTSSIDNVFFVFIEKNVTLCVDSSQTACTPDVTSSTNTTPFCAYHSFFSTNTIYAAIPYAASPNFNFGCTTGGILGLPGSSPNNDDADQTINVTSHEQMEAATDPLLNAWFNSNNFEIADLCAFTFGPGNSQGADVVWNTNPYIVQQEWSNAISGCTLTTSTATTYYKFVNGKSGLVMDVAGGGTNAGAQVIQWPYHNGANQQWALVPDGFFFQFVNRNSGLVLDVAGASTNPGANLIQWTNHNGFNQQWFLVPDGGFDVIVNVNSNPSNPLVADVAGASTSPGAHVIQWTFHNGLNQQWALVPINPYDKIVNRNSGLVADVAGASTSPGAHVIQWTFHNGLNQQWALVPDGAFVQIMNLHSGLVMDVAGASTNAGAQVIQWTNHNGLNQQWSIVTDGTFFQIVNRNSGLVLDVSGASTNAGVNVIQSTNNNGLSQQWSLIPTSA